MKTKQYLAIVLGTMLCFALSAEAVVNIQNVGAGARSQALGNSFVAVADNPDAVFENPAGVGRLERRQVAYTNVSLFFSGIDDGNNLGQHVVSYVQPLGAKLGLGLGFERIGSDLMNENGAFLSMGVNLSQKLSLGLNAKYLFWSVGDFDPADPLSGQSAGGVGVDVGVLWDSPLAGAKLGVLLKNVNEPGVSKGKGMRGVRRDTNGNGVLDPGDGLVAEEDVDAGKLPADLHVGVSYQVNPSSLLSVQWVVQDVRAASALVEAGTEFDEALGVDKYVLEERSSRMSKLVLGGETRLREGLMLRAGGSRVFEEEAQGALNAGLGYRWNTNLLFDYSYHLPLDLVETNGAHRFSFGYEF